MTNATYTKEIPFNRANGDYDAFVIYSDGTRNQIGSYSNRHQAEVALDNYIFDLLQHDAIVATNPELAYAASECDVPPDAERPMCAACKLQCNGIAYYDGQDYICVGCQKSLEDYERVSRFDEPSNEGTAAVADVDIALDLCSALCDVCARYLTWAEYEAGATCKRCSQGGGPAPLEEAQILDNIVHDGLMCALCSFPHATEQCAEVEARLNAPATPRTELATTCRNCGGMHNIQYCPEVHASLTRPDYLTPELLNDIQTIAAELAENEQSAGNRAGMNAVNKAALYLANGVDYQWVRGDLLIASGTRAGTVHRVRLSGGATWLCSCEAAANGKDCWHCCAAQILASVHDRSIDHRLAA